jgi:signal transduction histidine kinase
LRISRGRIDLADLVRTCAEQVAITADGREITCELPSTPVSGWWDRTCLEQVCQNLLTNAVKYSPDGAPIRVRVSRGARLARLTVSDQGVGIPESDPPYVFDCFYRVRAHQERAQGLGLGLYITRSLVELHGSQIAVQSRVGEGTTFTVSLPYGEPNDE